MLDLSGRVSGFTAKMRRRQCDEVCWPEPADEACLRVIQLSCNFWVASSKQAASYRTMPLGAEIPFPHLAREF